MNKINIYILTACLSIANLSFSQSLKNKVVAHQGAWLGDSIPGNSMASLKRAIALGCGGSEFDVWLTADKLVVVNHDPIYQGLKIESSTYAELATKKATDGERIPTLEEFILEGKKQKYTQLVLEIKPSHVSKDRTLALAEICVGIVKDLNARKLIDYISFDYDAGLRVIDLDKKAHVSYLSAKLTAPAPDQLKEDGFAGLDYHFSVYKSHPEYIQQARTLGLTTNAWTVDKKPDLQWLLENDVDYITTNKPKVLFELLNN